MERALGAAPWLAGSAFSLADIAYAPYVTRLDHLQLVAMWKSRPRLAEWYARIRERAGYQDGLTRWFNPKYLELMAEKGRETWPRVAEILSGRDAAAA